MVKDIVVNIDINTGEAEKAISDTTKEVDNLRDSTKETSYSFSDFGDIAGSVTGGITQKIGGATSALKIFTGGFKTLRAAIISTGVGALVVALGSLIAYFTSSEEGAKKLKIATEFLGGVFGVLTERASKLGELIVQAFTEPEKAFNRLTDALRPVYDFFQDINTIIVAEVMKTFNRLGAVISFLVSKYYELTGNQALANQALLKSVEYAKAAEEASKAQAESWNDIKEAAGDAVDFVVEGFKSIVEETQKALDVAERYANAQINTRNLIQKLIIENAKLNATIEEEQKKIDDTTRSYEERVEALGRQSEASAQLAENIAKQARAEESLLRQSIAIESNYEAREALETELANKIAERIDAEKQINIVNLENAQKTREIEREEVDRKKAIIDQIKSLQQEATTDQRARETEQLNIDEANALRELELLRATEDEKQAIRDAYAEIRANKDAEYKVKEKEASDKLAEEEKANAKAVSDAKMQFAFDTMSAVSEIAEMIGAGDEKRARKAFEVSKALNTAQALMSTYGAVNTILKDETIPPPAKPFVIASAITTGLLNVAKIQRTKFKGGATGSASGGGSLSLNSQVPPTPTLNANGLTQQPEQNIRAYVVDKNLTTAQSQTQKIEEQASLVL